MSNDDDLLLDNDTEDTSTANNDEIDNNKNNNLDAQKLRNNQAVVLSEKSDKRSIGILDILVNQKIITLDQIQAAKIEVNHRGKANILDVLCEMGFVKQSVIYNILSESDGENDKKFKNFIISSELLQIIPKAFAIKYKVLPLKEDTNTVTIATSDPYNIMIINQIADLFNNIKEIITIPYSETEIAEGINKYYESSNNIINIIEELEHDNTNYENVSSNVEDENPIVKLINVIIFDALKIEASDIHIEPDECFIRIRYRVDGVLLNKAIIHKNHWSALSVRVKILSEMNIAESRKPQDGSISMTIQGRHVDFRVSTMPTVNGENIVLRILDRTKGIMKLEELGFNQTNLNLLKLGTSKPEGIIIVTGPTGSGKTTTLYSILSLINSIEDNIMTLEEPVEYRLPMIRQSEINHKIGFDFASGLRTLLRQDPDIIFLGEIRDEETAQTALRAAATGHQVFSTLHTNGAIPTITRLIDMGIKPFMLSGALNAVIAQRLTRRLCDNCKKNYT